MQRMPHTQLNRTSKLLRIQLGLTLGLWLACLPAGWALILSGGKDPIQGKHNWPKGVNEMVNLSTRERFWEGPPFGGGNYHFLYVCKQTAEFQLALDTFARIAAPRLELIVLDGRPDAPGDKAVSHWELEIWDADNYEKLNSMKGSLSMSDSPWFGRPLPPPLLTVYLTKDSPIVWKEVAVPKNVTLLDRRVESSPYAQSTGGVISVTVRDMSNRLPLADAEVIAGQLVERNFEPRQSARTNKDGLAVVRDLPPGNYVIAAKHEGFALRELGYYQNFDRTLGVFDDAALAPVAVVAGRVTDSQGNPLTEVTIRIQGLAGLDGMGYTQNLFNEKTKTQTGADGRFALEGLPQGAVTLSVDKKDYYFFSLDKITLPNSDIKIVMARNGVIEGRVLGAEKLDAKLRAFVQLDPKGDPIGRWGGTKKCEADGTFRFEGVPQDTYTITPFVAEPETSGYSTEQSPESQAANAQTFTFIAGETKQLELKLTLK